MSEGGADGSDKVRVDALTDNTAHVIGLDDGIQIGTIVSAHEKPLWVSISFVKNDTSHREALTKKCRGKMA